MLDVILVECLRRILVELLNEESCQLISKVDATTAVLHNVDDDYVKRRLQTREQVVHKIGCGIGLEAPDFHEESNSTSVSLCKTADRRSTSVRQNCNTATFLRSTSQEHGRWHGLGEHAELLLFSPCPARSRRLKCHTFRLRASRCLTKVAVAHYQPWERNRLEIVVVAANDTKSQLHFVMFRPWENKLIAVHDSSDSRVEGGTQVV